MARCGKCDRVEEGSGGYGRNTWRYHVFTGNFRSVTRLTVILAEAAGGAEAAPLEPPPPPTTRLVPCVPLMTVDTSQQVRAVSRTGSQHCLSEIIQRIKPV